MQTIEMITLAVLLLLSISFFVAGYFQYKEKGVLFNNAYLYASMEERKRMNKKPHYRQSAIVFVMVGVMSLLNAIEIFLRSGWMFYVSLGLTIILVIYAIVSSIIINKEYK